MLGFLFAMLGALPYYSRSKYFPRRYDFIRGKVPGWIGALSLFSAAAVYVLQWDWVVGGVLALTVIPAAYCFLVFVLTIHRGYAAALAGLFIVFLLIDLIY